MPTKTKLRKLKRLKATSYLASWNTQGGMTTKLDLETFNEDMKNRKISICAIQETRNKNTTEIDIEGNLFIFFGVQANGYGGLGFYVSRAWKHRLTGYQLRNERIAVIKFQIEENENENEESRGKKGNLVIINIYGHTQFKTKNTPEVVEAFFRDLKKIYNEEKKGAQQVFIMGDFNAKLGNKIHDEEEFMGEHGRGSRNANGDMLKDFLEETKLYVANTHFKHRPMQTATWHGGKPASKAKPHRAKLPGLHNQIDYIIVKRRQMRLISDSRSYMPHIFKHRSDHSMVITEVRLGEIYRLSPAPKLNKDPKRDIQILANNIEVRLEYQSKVSQMIREKIKSTDGATARHAHLKEIVKQAANETLPEAPRKINGKIKFFNDEEIQTLSKEQQVLTARIYRGDKDRKKSKLDKLKRERNKIFERIRRRQKELEEERINNIAESLQNSSSTRDAFEAARILRKTKSQPLTLQDSNGGEIKGTKKKLKEITEFYKGFFTRQGDEPVNQFIGESRSLNTEITNDEVEAACRKLRNHRATGPDKIEAELWKYGGTDITEEIAKMINDIFKNHESISEIKEGHLFALNKPGKPRKAENTRPIILLTALRKILSTIVGERMKEKVNKYLSPSQHAYREGRSTTEVIWALQWLRATIEKYGEEGKMVALDLSKAFDNLGRKELLVIIERENIANEDELRILRYLLSNTKLKVKIEGEVGNEFETIIGTPQGDSLSPVLFLIYLENILRTFPHKELFNGPKDTRLEYADDVNLLLRQRKGESDKENHTNQCLCAKCRIDKIMENLPGHFAEHKMQLNAGKTVYADMSVSRCTIGTILGNNIEGSIEIEKRKAKAAIAFNGMWQLWKNSVPVSVEKKMKIYNGLVMPFYIHSAGSLVLKRTELDKLDAHHRKQLRRLLGVFYPEHISNEKVYEKTRTRPISVEIAKARWTLMGHILRRAKDKIPAYQVMEAHFKRRENQVDTPRNKTRRGRLLTTIPRLLQLDIQKVKNAAQKLNLFGVKDLDCGSDLLLLKMKAENRANWIKIVKFMEEYEVEAWKTKNKANSTQRTQRNEANNAANRGVTRGRGRPRGSRGNRRGRARPDSIAILNNISTGGSNRRGGRGRSRGHSSRHIRIGNRRGSTGTTMEERFMIQLNVPANATAEQRLEAENTVRKMMENRAERRRAIEEAQREYRESEEEADIPRYNGDEDN